MKMPQDMLPELVHYILVLLAVLWANVFTSGNFLLILIVLIIVDRALHRLLLGEE